MSESDQTSTEPTSERSTLADASESGAEVGAGDRRGDRVDGTGDLGDTGDAYGTGDTGDAGDTGDEDDAYDVGDGDDVGDEGNVGDEGDEGDTHAGERAESATPADSTEPADNEDPAATEPARDLEREGDIAADYLEGLLDIADLDGDIDLDVENDRAMVSIVGDNLDDLVGDKRRTLDALQELTRLAVLRETGERTRLMLDVGGARARRRAELVGEAEKVIARVRAESASVRLAPMNPFERKVVHDAVAAAGLTSESEGVEPTRYVVVSPPSA